MGKAQPTLQTNTAWKLQPTKRWLPTAKSSIPYAAPKLAGALPPAKRFLAISTSAGKKNTDAIQSIIPDNETLAKLALLGAQRAHQ